MHLKRKRFATMEKMFSWHVDMCGKHVVCVLTYSGAQVLIICKWCHVEAFDCPDGSRRLFGASRGFRHLPACGLWVIAKPQVSQMLWSEKLVVSRWDSATAGPADIVSDCDREYVLTAAAKADNATSQ